MRIRIRYILLAGLLAGGIYFVCLKIERSQKLKLAREEQVQVWKSAFNDFLKIQNISSRQVRSKEYPELALVEKKIRIPAQQSFTQLNLQLTEFADQNHVTLSKAIEDVKKRSLTIEFGPSDFIFLRVIFLKDEQISWNPTRIALVIMDSDDKGLLEDFARLDTKLTFSIAPQNKKGKEISQLANSYFQEYVYQCPITFDKIKKTDLFSISPGMGENEIRDRVGRGLTEVEDGKGIVLIRRLDERKRRIVENIAKKNNLALVDFETIFFLQESTERTGVSSQIKRWVQSSKRNLIISIPPTKNVYRGLESGLRELYQEGIEFVFLSQLSFAD